MFPNWRWAPLEARNHWEQVNEETQRTSGRHTFAFHAQGNEQGLVPLLLDSVQSVVILLQWLHVAVVKPCHGMTIGAEHCRAGHVQA